MGVGRTGYITERAAPPRNGIMTEQGFPGKDTSLLFSVSKRASAEGIGSVACMADARFIFWTAFSKASWFKGLQTCPTPLQAVRDWSV